MKGLNETPHTSNTGLDQWLWPAGLCRSWVSKRLCRTYESNVPGGTTNDLPVLSSCSSTPRHQPLAAHTPLPSHHRSSRASGCWAGAQQQPTLQHQGAVEPHAYALLLLLLVVKLGAASDEPLSLSQHQHSNSQPAYGRSAGGQPLSWPPTETRPFFEGYAHVAKASEGPRLARITLASLDGP